jgi:hypothetical protein
VIDVNPQSLEEYLVSIGWQVDKKSFAEALGSLSQFKDTSKILSMNAGQLLLKAASSFIKIGWQVTKTIFDMSSAMAQTDITVERFARATASSERTARAYMRTMEALGQDATSFEDLFLMTNEEYARFKDIYALSQRLEAPQGLQDTLVSIRDIQHEINKFKIILQYAGDWFVYFLGEQLGVEIDDLKQGLKGINDYLEENIQPNTKKLAEFVAPFLRIIIEILTWLTKVGTKIMEVGSESEVFETIGGLLDSIGNALSTIFELLNLILGLDGDLNSLAATFEIIGAVLDAISTIINGIADTIKFIIALIKGENFVDALEKSYSNTAESFNRGRGHIDRLLGLQDTRAAMERTAVQTKVANDLAAGMNRYETNNRTNNNNTTVNNTFNINGAKEPAAIGNEVYKAAIRSADNNALVGD